LIVVDVDRDGRHWLTKHEDEMGAGPLATTPRGGSHYYYSSPPGVTIRSRTGAPAKGVDIRARGGYVVAPSGPDRTWLRPLDAPACELQPPPDWLLEALLELERARGTSRIATSTDYHTIPEGARNDTLARLAGAMRRWGAAEDEILDALRARNERGCVPPLDEREVERIAQSIARYAPEPIEGDEETDE